MSDFVERIEGKQYNIEEAKQLFMEYTLRHKGKISQRFKDTIVKIYPYQLPNGSRALANTNVTNNTINIREGQSIVTFFHECKHLSDAWKDSSGNWHTNWENEEDYDAQMSYVDRENNIIDIKRGIKGLAMGEAVAELFASKVYWDLCHNSPQAYAYTAQTRKVYDEEIINLKKVITILGINEDELLSWKSDNNFGRNRLDKLFMKLTGIEDFWEKLEYRMDYIFMPKFIQKSHPHFRIHQTALKNVKLYKENIDNLLNVCLRKDIQERYYKLMGCSKEEFEMIYQNKLKEFEQLNQYLISTKKEH